MARIGATSRRDLWFAAAGIGVGLSTTLLAGGLGLGEREQSWMTFALVTLVALFPTLLAADVRLSAHRSALRTGVLCFVLAIPTVLVLQRARSSSGLAPPVLWAIRFVCAFITAAFLSLAYGPALVVAGRLARSASERPAGSIGAGRWLLVLVACITCVASWGTVSVSHGGGYALWWELLSFDVLLAVLCAGVAVRDGAWAVRLHAVASNRDPSLRAMAGVAAPPCVPHLATPTVRRSELPVALVRVCAVRAGAYRASASPAPVLLLDGPPARVVASLRRSALLTLALSLALAGAAARAREIAHAPRIPRQPEIARAPVGPVEYPAEQRERLERYAPWWLRDALASP